jgi:glycosyltransferase involved in cell wall biosynthesis
MTQVLLICNDVVGENMAGPGIRYWELTQALNQYFEVNLIVPPFVADQTKPSDKDWLRICHSVQELRTLVSKSDVIITLGIVLFLYPFITKMDIPLVVDLYDPFLLEDLQRKAHANWLDRLTSYENYLEALRFQLQTGDFFICAGEKQQDYWLGMLSALGRVNPYTYQKDPSLQRLIDIVPFGLPAEPPKHTKSVLKGVFQSIRPHDKVILWGGGIWEWFDAPTLIQSMPRILARRNDVKLFFMGVNRSNQDQAQAAAVKQSIQLSKALGLYETHIFFNDWVPYSERQNYLMEADLGVSLHLDHVEARFAFRTRLLDYLWAGLPIVSTAGDVIGEDLASQKIASLVAPGDVEGVAQTVLDVLDDPKKRQKIHRRMQKAAKDYRWEVVAKPLVNFCNAPYFAPDRDYRTKVSHHSRLPRLTHKIRQTLRLGGIKAAFTRLCNYARWKARNL